MSFLRKSPNSPATEFAATAAGAREMGLGNGKSLGSRGSRTYEAPQATRTAPGSAPIERSMTDKRTPTATKDERAGDTISWSVFAGWRGMLTAAVIAMSTGIIFGFNAIAGIVGLLLQFALVGGAIYAMVNFINSRAQPALAPPRDLQGASPGNTPNRSSFAFSGGARPLATMLTTSRDDLDSFERLLMEINSKPPARTALRGAFWM